MKTIRIEGNYIDAEGLTRTRSDRAMYVGDFVLTIDNDGHTRMATVVRIGANGTVHLVLDPASWREELVPI